MTLTEFHAALPGAPAEFVLAAFEAGESAEAAAKRWTRQLVAENAELKQAVADMTVARYMMPGVDPLVGVTRVW